MAISEAQLTTWAKQGTVPQSASTYQTIRKVLNSSDSPYYKYNFDIFLQGSYGNDTNVWADSDVDVVICLTSVYYDDTSNLDEAARERYRANFSPATYSYNQFKSEVLAWLKKQFGSGVEAGKKAIFVPGNGSRRDADVLVCAEHRAYNSYSSTYANSYRDGVCFWTSDGTQIINYPKQHMANCTTKQQGTSNRFKPNIRVLKNMRNSMIDHGYIKDGLAPSYFLEGMLYNIPNQNFASSYQQTFENYMYWLNTCAVTELVCANEYYYLLREGSPVTWRVAPFNEFRAAAMRYWNQP